MKNYVITMMNHTQSNQAAMRCVKSGQKFNEKIVKFSAVTPEKKPLIIAERENIPLQAFHKEGNKYSRFYNVLSAFLSHYSLWKKCVELDEPIRIFEHDAVIRSALPSIPMAGMKCVSLGWPSYGRFNTPSTLGINRLTSKAYFPGAHAYQISPAGAKQLVERSKIDAGPTDVFLHIKRFPWLEEYYPWPVTAEDYFTTIQTERGCQAKHNYQANREGYEIL